ncbi:MAG TPA: tetratricopeptide repeat protein [Nannocystis exedens]|nr:tetratricopeptide repeat protein [Nannocystis exedens]
MSKERGRLRLASPTMAQIYMRQGHFHRARETLDAVLRSDPTSGAAHVLRERLALLDGATVSGRVSGDARNLDLRWKAAPTGTHVLVVLFRGRDVYVTSRPCKVADGRWRVDIDSSARCHAGTSPGAAAISLVRPGEHGVATPVAVAEPLCWD